MGFTCISVSLIQGSTIDHLTLLYSVSLVNASSGLTALWVLLSTTGFALFILFPVKWGFVWLARHTGALEAGQPSAFMTTVTILMVFASAFMTDILGMPLLMSTGILPLTNVFRCSSYLWWLFGRASHPT